MRSTVTLLSLLGLVLAGCQTASHKLPLEQIADLRVAEVVVSVPDGGQIPEDLRNGIAPKVKAAFERQLTQRFKGSNPVRVEVTVRGVVATPTVERVVFGGGSSMTADMTMVDLRTKSVLLTYPDKTAQLGGRGGLMEVALDRAITGGEPIEFLAQNLAFQFAEWIRPSEAP